MNSEGNHKEILISFKVVLQYDFSLEAQNELDMVLHELDIQPMSMEQVNILSKPFPEDEIKEAMFAMGNNKSLGIYGFTTGFFHTHSAGHS